MQAARGQIVVRFVGLAGLEDHQYGKQVYYDQDFLLRSYDVELSGARAVAHTTGEWRCRHCEPRMARSEELRAELAHTWHVRRRLETERAVLALHVCTWFHYLEGYQPAGPAAVGAPREFHLDFDRHWRQ